MMTWLLPENHALAILKQDHDDLKELFEEFRQAKTKAARQKIIETAVTLLKIHATLEEEIFYPAVRPYVDLALMNEADEEHHVARLLVAELDTVRDDHTDAKFLVLSESVKHHIKEEEGKMMPAAENSGVDFEALGEKLLARRRQLLEKGVPPDLEHKMIGRAKGLADTPAAAAKRGGKKKAVAKKSARVKVPKAHVVRAGKSRSRAPAHY